MAAMDVATGRMLARGFGPRVVRAGRLAQPARETVRGLGAQGPAALGAAVGAGFAADPVEGAKLPPAGVQGPRPVQFAGSLPQLGEVWLERAQQLTQDERAMIGAFVERRRLRPAAGRGKPFGTDIRSWVVLLARTVGWRPSKRQPYPSNEVLWRAYVRLQTMVLGMQTLRGS